MPAETPLVGRDQELATVVEALGADGCVVGGVAGVGKSRLAAEAARSTRRHVARVLATASSGSIPFGAFGHLLTGRASSPGSIPTVIEALAGLGDDLVLVVDDAHLLDDASAAVLPAIVASGTATLLVTVRSHEPTPDAVRSLWKERLVTRVDIQELSRGDLGQLIAHLLDAEPSGDVVDQLCDLSLGNPLLLRELVTDALDSRALVSESGRWHWRGDRLRFRRIVELVGSRVLGRDAETQRLLELVAVGGAVPLDGLLELVPFDVVERAERAGLLRRESGSDPVEFAHPLYGEVVAADMATTTVELRTSELADAFSGRSHGDDGWTLRVAGWMVDAGRNDDDLFLAAAAISHRRGSPELTLRLATAVAPSFDATLLIGGALIGLYRYDDAFATMLDAEEEARRADLPRRWEYVEITLRAALRGSVGHADVDDLSRRWEAWDTDPLWQLLLDAQRAWQLHYVNPRAAFEIVEPHVRRRDIPVRARGYLLFLALNAAGRAGLVRHFDDLDAEVGALIEEHSYFRHEAHLALRVIDAEGRGPAGIDVEGVLSRLSDAADAAQRRGDRAMQRMMHMYRTQLMLRQGHLADAMAGVDRLRPGVDEPDPLNINGFVLLTMAQSSAMAGDGDQASAHVARAEAWLDERPHQRARLAGELGTAEALADAAAGRLTDAADRLLTVAAECESDAQSCLDATLHALRLGASPARCRDQFERVDGLADRPFWAAVARFAGALADDNALAQLDAAEDLESLGFDLDAALAAGHAARASRAAGRRSTATRADAFAARVAARCAGVAVPELTAPTATPDLTQREREVARLAARGNSNAEIAATLVLSVRSVETYLLRVNRKLGINNRRQLAPFFHDTPEA